MALYRILARYSEDGDGYWSEDIEAPTTADARHIDRKSVV